MAEENGKTNGKFDFFFRREIQWIIWLSIFIAGLLAYYFIAKAQIDMNAYKIDQIVSDRTDKWQDQGEVNQATSKSLEEINKSLTEINTKLEFIQKAVK